MHKDETAKKPVQLHGKRELDNRKISSGKDSENSTAHNDREVETILVLSQKNGESIQIGTHVTIMIHKVSKTRVALTIEAPEDIRILRSELVFGAELQGDMGRVALVVDEI